MLYECFSLITTFCSSSVWDRTSSVGWRPTKYYGRVWENYFAFLNFFSVMGKKEYIRESHFPWLISFPYLWTVTLVTASITGLFSWAGVVERRHPGNSPLEFPHSSPFPFHSLPSSLSGPVAEYSTSGLHDNNSAIWISFWWKKFFPDDCRSFQILSEHHLQCPAGSTSLNHYAVYPHPGLSVEGQVSFHFRSHKTSKMFRKNRL